MSSPHRSELLPFRRRIKIVRTWKCASYGLTAGTALAVVATVLDYFNVIYGRPILLYSVAIAGTVAGVAWALIEPLSDSAIARSVDRRGNLADRLTTATELCGTEGLMVQHLIADASTAADSLVPGQLYPIRFNRWHGISTVLAVIAIALYLFTNTTIFRSPEAKVDAAELKNDADQIERIAKPLLDPPDKRTVTAEDTALAHRLDQFSDQLRRGRMSKEEALVRANQLQQEAKALQDKHSDALANSIQSAQTAAEQLSAMDKSAAADNAARADQQAAANAQAKSLEDQIRTLQQKLGSASTKSQMSPSQKKALQQQLASDNKRLRDLQLSQNALKFLSALSSMADFRKAQELLSKLSQASQASASGQQTPMSQAQMQKMADELEKMAKEFNSNAKLKELARRLLEAAKNARLANGARLAAGIGAAMGSGGETRTPDGFSTGAMPGAGGPGNERWIGDHGSLIKSNKSSQLKVTYKDEQITSLIGDKGAETYTETMGPSGLGSKSSVPYQSVLPKYTKTAEAALNRGEVPPQMKSRVRDYFDSLRK